MIRRRVVITGAGRGFGRTAAIEFARRGDEVFLSARTLSAAENTRNDISAVSSSPVHAFSCDISDAAAVRAFATAVRELTDSVDILVNNAAGWLEGLDLDSAAAASV